MLQFDKYEKKLETSYRAGRMWSGAVAFANSLGCSSTS